MQNKIDQNKTNPSGRIKRRIFFGKLTKAIAALALLKFLPIRFFSNYSDNISSKNKITVKVHPLAVKYGTRKVNGNE
ncbi:MAG: hypothetical protein Q8933_18635 [Bacteroidota bacterium]|nr:hypothetical protein [Bacteroidota bacterium]MDP4197599.1 hypothetical protein [Bacteroidota bacterium]